MAKLELYRYKNKGLERVYTRNKNDLNAFGLRTLIYKLTVHNETKL